MSKNSINEANPPEEINVFKVNSLQWNN